ncbi:MAG: hypothetical protein JNK87_14330 [Bryobacterales bacterium]|nr:hypothetical protein [Bryobacterales bacterium]
MVLTAQEQSLIGILRALPPHEAEKVFLWANHLSDLAGDGGIQWSDAWTEEDLADATEFALRCLDDTAGK